MTLGTSKSAMAGPEAWPPGRSGHPNRTNDEELRNIVEDLAGFIFRCLLQRDGMVEHPNTDVRTGKNARSRQQTEDRI